MSVKYFNPMTNLFILRVGREETPTVWAAATLMTAIHNRTVMVRILKTSGALRKAQAEIIAHDKRVLGWVEIRGCGGNLYVYIYMYVRVCVICGMRVLISPPPTERWPPGWARATTWWCKAAKWRRRWLNCKCRVDTKIVDRSSYLMVAFWTVDLHGPLPVMNGTPLYVATPLASVERSGCRQTRMVFHVQKEGKKERGGGGGGGRRKGISLSFS